MHESLGHKPVQSEISDGVARDLSSKFDIVGGENKSEGNCSNSTDIETDSANCTPVKRGIIQVAGDDDEAGPRILKNIKIEKE